MANFWDRTCSILVQKLERTKKIIRFGKISGKGDILTVQDQERAHKGNKTNIIIEMNPWQINTDERILKAATMQMKKLTRKEKGLLSYNDGKRLSELMNVEASKGYKKNNLRLNNQKHLINMSSWRSFITTYIFKFRCMISCTLILIQLYRTTIFINQKKSNYKKRSTPGPFPKHWLIFSYPPPPPSVNR